MGFGDDAWKMFIGFCFLSSLTEKYPDFLKEKLCLNCFFNHILCPEAAETKTVLQIIISHVERL